MISLHKIVEDWLRQQDDPMGWIAFPEVPNHELEAILSYNGMVIYRVKDNYLEKVLNFKGNTAPNFIEAADPQFFDKLAAMMSEYEKYLDRRRYLPELKK